MTPEHIAAIKARVEKALSAKLIGEIREEAAKAWHSRPNAHDAEWAKASIFAVFTLIDALEHARTDIPALIAALEAAEAERDTYCAKLVNLADAEVSGLSWGGFNIIGDEKSVKAVQSAVHYSGQIEEYRTAFADRIAALEAERDALKADRETIIRGTMLLEQKLKAELSDAKVKVAKYEMEAFKEAFHKAEAAKLRRSIPILSPGALEDSI